jgi:hypothetical protein
VSVLRIHTKKKDTQVAMTFPEMCSHSRAAPSQAMCAERGRAAEEKAAIQQRADPLVVDLHPALVCTNQRLKVVIGGVHARCYSKQKKKSSMGSLLIWTGCG